MSLPFRLYLTLPEEETDDKVTAADEKSWLEQISDLWDKYLPHLRKKQSIGFIKPTADQYGFKQEEEIDQSIENTLGTAILRGIEKEDKEKAEPISENEAGELVESEEKGADNRHVVDSIPQENCKNIIFIVICHSPYLLNF